LGRKKGDAKVMLRPSPARRRNSAGLRLVAARRAGDDGAMNELDPPGENRAAASPEGAGAVVEAFRPRPAAPAPVTFDRRELQTILNLYGRMVAAGEWRDYAIDFSRDKAVFSIFRRAAEQPLYRIEKTPRLSRRQGAYAVIAAGGMILKRGHELSRVLAVLDRKLKLVTG
jgi:hypothetical protein